MLLNSFIHLKFIFISNFIVRYDILCGCLFSFLIGKYKIEKFGFSLRQWFLCFHNATPMWIFYMQPLFISSLVYIVKLHMVCRNPILYLIKHLFCKIRKTTFFFYDQDSRVQSKPTL